MFMSYRTSKMKRMQETMEKIQEIDRNSLLTLQERHQRGLITLRSCWVTFCIAFVASRLLETFSMQEQAFYYLLMQVNSRI